PGSGAEDVDDRLHAGLHPTGEWAQQLEWRLFRYLHDVSCRGERERGERRLPEEVPVQRRTVESERRAAVGPRATEQVQRPPRVAVDRVAVPARQTVTARREGDDDAIAHREIRHVPA